jgi:hypothetical protein
MLEFITHLLVWFMLIILIIGGSFGTLILYLTWKFISIKNNSFPYIDVEDDEEN